MKTIKAQRLRTRIARILLALFVLSWINLIVQAPVHAAMKQSNEMPCHCDHTLCDTVLGMQDQADDGVSGVAPVIQNVMQMLVIFSPDYNQPRQIVLQYQKSDLDYRVHSPPPITRTGVLRI